GWSGQDIRAGLVAAVVVSALALFFLARGRPLPGSATGRAVLGVCAAILVWALVAQLQASASNVSYSERLTAILPRPLRWVDRATQGHRAVYVGQRVVPKTDVFTLSFWNRSLVGVFRLDRTRARDVYPVTVGPEGVLPVASRARFVVAGYGVRPVGRPLTHR